ncbi:NADPH:adrenodoxin oxidoreductase, mitochondrial [Ixodes scapularis]|uniref:NADPH:adrenodoxin oxidoreductase, mitochondrial n=1 Tax=Ixodes scapularis TaxID=6945 RepID=UPI001C38D168|nr:NADPH:adrenodoxin oxidoreductase, mitochondrial [Ixodes scapularis]
MTLASLTPRKLSLLNQPVRWCLRRHFERRGVSSLKVSIVGAGPAGFYTAQQVLKHPGATVDIYEGLPVPFGLVRFGVAPDHPEVKNVVHTFTNIAKNPRCHFYGNVRLGLDVSLADLRKAYHAVVLTYGADQEKNLGIPGEDLPNVLSARKFVGWYNGHPADAGVNPDLSGNTAVVIGHGNVALDVARILLSSPERLQMTDIAEPALAALRRSNVRRVILVGRRGPLEVSFTIKELREMTKLPGVGTVLRAEDFAVVRDKLADLPRPRKRLLELLLQTAEKQHADHHNRAWELRFLRSPARFVGGSEGGRISAVEFSVNRLEGEGSRLKAVPTGDTETLECQLALRSIGYSTEMVDPDIPFDAARGIIPNTEGRVESLPGVYCSGWVKTGPVGVLVATMNSSFETGQALVKDAESGLLPTSDDRGGSATILQLLESNDVTPVTFDQWLKIDEWERTEGSRRGKPSEKLLSIEQMLKIARS